MSNTEQTSVPGLGVWAALLIAGCCLVYWMTRIPTKDEVEEAALQSYLFRKSSLPGKQAVVMVLGTSLTASGLDSSGILEKNIRERSGQDTRLVKAWELDAGPTTFSDLAPAFQHFKPAVVVVEANMLFYTFSKNRGLSTYLQSFRGLINGKNRVYLPDAKPVLRKRTIAEMESYRRGFMDTTELAAFGDLLAAWQKQGSRLILLNFPLEASLEIKKWNSADTAFFFRNLAYLNQRCQLQYSDPKMRLDELNYIDHAHMNQQGQKKQSDFFCTLVAGQLRKQ